MSKNNENNPAMTSLLRGSVAADVTGLPGLYMAKKSKILGIRLAARTGLVADNTNYVLLSIKNGALVVASYDSRAAGQGGLTAGVSVALAMDPNAVGADVPAAGSDLTVDVDVHGTGALVDANLTAEYFPL